MKNFQIQPMMPMDPDSELGDLAADVLAASSYLAGAMRPQIQLGVAELVRSMNCYYSNLIEGHPTTPREIDEALDGLYSDDPETRSLQHGARNHIETQRKIDQGEVDISNPVSLDFAKWVHKDFCTNLPDDLLIIENPETGRKIRVVPGELRDGEVRVGRHIPPLATDVPYFMREFEEVYSLKKLRKIQSIVAVAASHQRFVWIHPFYDGNGRVARLMAHAFLMRIDVGSCLWSVSRGLARSSVEYKDRLAAADEPRHGDLDGRGALSDKRLFEFSRYFLQICLDQIKYMTHVLDPKELDQRIFSYCNLEMSNGNLPKRSDLLLRAALNSGEIHRGSAPEITGYQERRARDVLTKLIEMKLLVSTGPRKPVRLGFPSEVADRWFPKLYSVE